MMRLSLLGLLFFLKIALLQSQNHADCASAMDICKKQVYHVDRTGGEGRDNTEADFVPCFMNGENHGQAEENSTWIKFEIEKSGTLTFAITPHRLDDDIDFVVFKLPPDGNCLRKQIIRCMAAGDSRESALTSRCMGETGLRSGEKASSRDAGCNDPGDNTWLAPLKVEKGEKYALLISNVSSVGPGFSIRFGGTAKLPCDDEKPPVAEKPKSQPKPQPPVPEPPKPSPSVAAPEKIGGREVEVSKVVNVKTYKIKIKIWDSQVQDGDIVSIYIDDRMVVSRIYLTLKPKEFEIELPAGKKEHYLTVYADDFGKAEPNTCKMTINDGVSEQTIDFVAGRRKQDSVKIITE